MVTSCPNTSNGMFKSILTLNDLSVLLNENVKVTWVGSVNCNSGINYVSAYGKIKLGIMKEKLFEYKK